MQGVLGPVYQAKSILNLLIFYFVGALPDSFAKLDAV